MRCEKPEPHAKTQARLDRLHQKARKLCVEAVWARAQGRCEGCGRYVEPYDGTNGWRWNVGHVHEIVKRSQGGSDTDPANCRLLCAGTCHRGAHGLGRAS